MSQENVELVRKATEAWNSGGVEATLEFYPEDVVWYPFRDSPESATGFRGHQGIREVVSGWNDGTGLEPVTTCLSGASTLRCSCRL